MKKRVFDYLFIIYIFSTVTLFGQENFGFSNLDFTNWDLHHSYGYTSPDIETKYYKLNSPHYDAWHSINTIIGFDVNTLSKLKFIPEGETCSVRLDNSNNGSQSEKLSYIIEVNSENVKGHICCKYAIVFQNSLIDSNTFVQFKFRINGYLNGELLEESFEVNASTKDSKFNLVRLPNRCIKWKDWTEISFDLKNYEINDKIRFEFENYDCAIGQSFGYAYLVTDYNESDKEIVNVGTIQKPESN